MQQSAQGKQTTYTGRGQIASLAGPLDAQGHGPALGPRLPLRRRKAVVFGALLTVQGTEREGARLTPGPSSPPGTRSCGVIRGL